MLISSPPAPAAGDSPRGHLCPAGHWASVPAGSWWCGRRPAALGVAERHAVGQLVAVLKRSGGGCSWLRVCFPFPCRAALAKAAGAVRLGSRQGGSTYLLFHSPIARFTSGQEKAPRAHFGESHEGRRSNAWMISHLPGRRPGRQA